MTDPQSAYTNRGQYPGTDDDLAAGNMLKNFADWRFNRYLTMQLLPLFYLLLMLGALAVIAGLVAMAFYFSPMLGWIAAGISPFVLLITIAVIRAALEYLIMAHRIMRIIERMDALPHQVADLSYRVDGITQHVDQLIHRVDDIHDALMHARPVLSALSLPRRLLERLNGHSR